MEIFFGNETETDESFEEDVTEASGLWVQELTADANQPLGVYRIETTCFEDGAEGGVVDIYNDLNIEVTAVPPVTEATTTTVPGATPPPPAPPVAGRPRLTG